MVFRISHPHIEGFFQSSKPLFYRVLFDTEEMEDLFSYLPSFALYNVSKLALEKEIIFSKKQFLEGYALYVKGLKKGDFSHLTLSKSLFSAVLSSTPKSFYAMEVKEKLLLKMLEPTIQLSLHRFNFCKENKTFHSMVSGKELVSWGLQFSYPTLYSNSKKGDVIKTMKQKPFPNNLLFRSLMRFIRSKSDPVFFLVDGERINGQMRLGKNCFSWIHTYKSLNEQGLEVERRKK